MTSEVIVRRLEAKPLSTLNGLRNFLHQRETAFHAAFLRAASDAPTERGWEIVTTIPGESVKKQSEFEDILDPFLVETGGRFPRRKEAVFTGKNYCTTVSTAIFDALLPHIDDQKILLEIGSVATDTNRENWERADYTLEESLLTSHTVLRATDTMTKEVMYIDGTYGQIDHRERGKIVTIPHDDYAAYYRVAPGGISTFLLTPFMLDIYRDFPDLKSMDIAAMRFSLTPASLN